MLFIFIYSKNTFGNLHIVIIFHFLGITYIYILAFPNLTKLDFTKSFLSCVKENTEDLKQMKQTLLDVETVALDAKRESAFLRSENLKLKEKMVSDFYNIYNNS